MNNVPVLLGQWLGWNSWDLHQSKNDSLVTWPLIHPSFDSGQRRKRGGFWVKSGTAAFFGRLSIRLLGRVVTRDWSAEKSRINIYPSKSRDSGFVTFRKLIPPFALLSTSFTVIPWNNSTKWLASKRVMITRGGTRTQNVNHLHLGRVILHLAPSAMISWALKLKASAHTFGKEDSMQMSSVENFKF